MLNLNLILFVAIIGMAQIALSQAAIGKSGIRKFEVDSKGVRDVEHDLNKLKSMLCHEESSTNERPKNKKAKDMPCFDDRFDRMPEECYKIVLPKDCAAATECVQRNGIYQIQVGQLSNEPFHVFCDAETENGGWIVIQRRQDGSEDFYRSWAEYENGFGDIDGEFFIGLKKLHALTNYNGPQELLIVMQSPLNKMVKVKYDYFSIGNETESYKLKRLGKYSGNVGDSLSAHINMKFSTRDRDNDINSFVNCAETYTGGWWYIGSICHQSNLNGKYGDINFGKGINWNLVTTFTASLPYVKMMIRPRDA